MSDEGDKGAIKSLLYSVIRNIDVIGLPKYPFIINAPSPDGHSIFLVIWPAQTGPSEGYKTRIIQLDKEKLKP
jgi:hypothetical protein